MKKTPTINCQEFGVIIHFIYSPQTLKISSFADHELWDLLYLANKYLLKMLITLVEDELRTRIKSMDFKPLLLNHYQFAKAYSIGEDLLPLIEHKIQKHAKDLLMSEEFLSLDLSDAIDVIKFEDLCASEGEIYEACYRWCKNGLELEEAFLVYQENFQGLICWDLMCLNSFEKHVFPNADLLSTSFIESLMARRDNMMTEEHSRLHMKPVKTISQIVPEQDLKNQHTEWTKFLTEEFYNSRVYISIKSIKAGSFAGEFISKLFLVTLLSFQFD